MKGFVTFVLKETLVLAMLFSTRALKFELKLQCKRIGKDSETWVFLHSIYTLSQGLLWCIVACGSKQTFFGGKIYLSDRIQKSNGNINMKVKEKNYVICVWNSFNTFLYSQCLIKRPCHLDQRVAFLQRPNIKQFFHVNVLTFKVDDNDMEV